MLGSTVHTDHNSDCKSCQTRQALKKNDICINMQFIAPKQMKKTINDTHDHEHLPQCCCEYGVSAEGSL